MNKLSQLAKRVGEQLKQHGLTLVTAEILYRRRFSYWSHRHLW